MIELLALILAPKLVTITEPSYKVGHCYKADKQENNLIQIINITDKSYWFDFIPTHRIYFINSFNTIENVYTEEVTCPNS